MKLYDLDISGNCYKVRLLLSLIGQDVELAPVDIASGEHKQADYVAVNPFGQLPALVDGALTLRDSQAILVYLARRYGGETWLPSDPAEMARIAQWLSVAANELDHGPYAARLGHQLGLPIDVLAAQVKARAILAIMDAHLAAREWLELDRATIADVACYPAVALAPLGDIDMTPYAALAAWRDRVAALPGYIAMPGIE
jgi:glutathione S-transferase